MKQIAGHIGRKTILATNHVATLMALTYRLVGLTVKNHPQGRALVRKVIFEQVYFTAIQALPLVIPIALILGSTLIAQFTKLAGQYDPGKLMVILVVREMGPMITALLVILRSATSVTIELGYMGVLNEIKSLEMAGVDPIRFICLPRLIGITSAILSLFIVFDLFAILGGYMIVWIFTYAPVGSFFNQIIKAITATDIIVGMIKALCFGVAITVTSLYHGFQTLNRITDIPPATSRAAIECFFYCIIINVFISLLFYM
jgi:phospholipid/cholesterol/gamma-HCH transport system permease protein